jgi:hypothetical protein
LVLYADDLNALATGPDIQELSDAINGYVPRLVEFFEERNLVVSAEKSSTTLFTPQNSQANDHPQVFVNGDLVPLSRESKILGVTHDTMYTFAPHCRAQAKTVRRRNDVLKRIVGTTWGQDRETLVMTYTAIRRSVVDYAAPIWAPVASDTAWKSLEAAQNDALRIATGCHSITAVDHLHQEAKVLPVRRHADLLADQYLLSCHRQIHPCHHHISDPVPPRDMKRTIWSNRDRVAHLTDRGPINERQYRAGLRSLHTEAVQSSIAAAAPNRVLGVRPPPVADSELTLPRRARTALAQLRSGFSRMLNSYHHRLSKGAIADVCPSCGSIPHDVHHVFNCRVNPTNLNPVDLWQNPVEVARFLDLAPIPDDDDE